MMLVWWGGVAMLEFMLTGTSIKGYKRVERKRQHNYGASQTNYSKI